MAFPTHESPFCRFRTAFAGLLAALTLATAAYAAEDRVALGYEMNVGGFRVGDLSVEAKLTADRYHAGVQMNSRGLIGALYDAQVDATANGLRGSDGTLQPTRFERTLNDGGAPEILRIGFAGDLPVAVEREPDEGEDVFRMGPEDRRASLDPASALVALMLPAGANPCDRRIPVFDGKRRYDFVLAPLDPDAPAAGATPSDTEGLVACRAQYERMAGFSAKQMAKDPLPPIDAWFRPVAGGRYYVPVMVTGRTPVGVAVLKNTRLEVGPATRAASAD
ncbi:DUF3108 domain-containing protein [Futiania mangrovi]|uniref:DUF3108 domain-containing protein n=1 Tax=Futiania mangrovi TaxID=2959716 RepID=A0A9J6PHW9_9PROT|nr:DUF3108 domain-containing protein [Futiania mangrovii]MCP1336167.1 DUF3108 domain-containing protein [Futiania mangrovii]